MPIPTVARGEFFEPLIFQPARPWPIQISERLPGLKNTQHVRVRMETLREFRLRMSAAWRDSLNDYCRYLRRTRLLPGLISRCFARDRAWAWDYQSGRSYRWIQRKYQRETGKLMTEAGIAKAISRVAVETGVPRRPSRTARRPR
jgi:hypothetical protein